MTVGASETAASEGSTVSTERSETTTVGSTEASSESSSEATSEVASTTEAESSQGTTPVDTDETTQETTTGNFSNLCFIMLQSEENYLESAIFNVINSN